MNQNIQLDYVTNLPDFMTMQRVSFCWFLSQGLSEELKLFSQILDFSQNTEYILYGEEYRLLRSPCNLTIARKYNGNYRAKLIIPIEARNRKTNIIYFYRRFPLISLPLMTTSATFILNGCERVIVSQIIRSPGIYFEKIKNQRRRKIFKRTLSTDITKLRSFLPAGQASFSDNDLYFSMPLLDINIDKKTLSIIPSWTRTSIVSYSIDFFKKSERLNNICYFLLAFRTYKEFLKITKSIKKSKIIYLYYKWLLFFQTKSTIYIDNNSSKTLIYVIKYFNILKNLIDFYKINNQVSSTNNFLKKYQNTIQFSLKLVQLNLNKNLIFLIKLLNFKIDTLQNFYTLKRNLIGSLTYKNYFLNQKNLLKLRLIIYFSRSLKDQLRHTFKKISKIDSKFQHQYTKSKTRLLIFNEDHKVKTVYETKYKNKELYNATLIPEYGSWIRFGFQKI